MNNLLKGIALATAAQAAEQVSYTVVEIQGKFEVRDYPNLNVAESSESFMTLYGFITGDNSNN